MIPAADGPAWALRIKCSRAHQAVGKFGNPFALGAKDRTFKSCQLDTRLRAYSAHKNKSPNLGEQKLATCTADLTEIPVKPVDFIGPHTGTADLAWCAGLFEGEGTVVYGASHAGPIKAKLSSTDKDVLDALVLRSGLGFIDGPIPPHGLGKKEFYTWHISGHAAVAFLLEIRPWLGKRRTGQVNSKVALWQERPRTGLKLLPDDKSAIQRLRESGWTYKTIGQKFGVSLGRVVQVCKEGDPEVWTYVAGPMSNIPEYNYPAFSEMAARLRAAGLKVIPPHELHPADPTRPWEWFLRRDLIAVASCRRIVMLPGWENSKGATLEHHVAQTLGSEIIYPNQVDTFLAAHREVFA